MPGFWKMEMQEMKQKSQCLRQVFCKKRGETNCLKISLPFSLSSTVNLHLIQPTNNHRSNKLNTNQRYYTYHI